jgi:large subunit ribosomal protein L1
MRGKRYQELSKLLDRKKLYSPAEAVDLACKTSKVKFDASVEAHIKLGINATKREQTVRGTAVLPHGAGRKLTVAAFVGSAKETEAREAGADLVGGEELINEIAESKKLDFDVAVASPDMMPKLAKIAKILGPKGLMPNPKTDTVGPDVRKMVSELKKGKIAFKNDDSGNVHVAIGKCSFGAEKLTQNFNALMEVLRKSKPASSKGVFIKSVSVSSSMGPGIKVAI